MVVATGPTTSVAEEAWRLLFELAKRKHSVLVPALAELDLTPVQGHALSLLDPEQPIAMSALADALFCHASNVTGIVDRLETRGLVERQAGREDRRVKTLVPTEAGKRVRSQVVELMRRPPPEIAELSASDQRALRDVLGRALDR